MSHFVKDPGAKKDYGIAWAAWLPAGDSILTSTWDVQEGLTLHSHGLNTEPAIVDGVTCPVGTAAIVWLSGCPVGQQLQATNRITTTQGRIEEKSIVIIGVEQ